MFKVKSIITNDRKYSYLIVFLIAIIFRVIPEIASPIPIADIL
jgi:hypothetical protein